ncbi:hypothetical protein A1D22_05700 [Pasteurellaceae bacterium LFhippo2]|nr:hypothetical protein [Pasteurellaceae bacterium LFhippo2]
MIDYQTLCQQNQQYQQRKSDYRELLATEIQLLKTELESDLGLTEKVYKVDLATDKTAPYVSITDQRSEEDWEQYPSLSFSLNLVLESEPNSYPKQTYSETLQVHFVQAERLNFSFKKTHPELKFVVNLKDDNQTKYRPIVEAYKQLLVKRLSR